MGIVGACVGPAIASMAGVALNFVGTLITSFGGNATESPNPELIKVCCRRRGTRIERAMADRSSDSSGPLWECRSRKVEKVREGSSSAMRASPAWITFWASGTAAANSSSPSSAGATEYVPLSRIAGHTTWVSHRRKARACGLRDSGIRSVEPFSVIRVTDWTGGANCCQMVARTVRHPIPGDLSGPTPSER
jgi:hypothetical protein